MQNFAIFRILPYLGPKAYLNSCLHRHIQAYSGIFTNDSYNSINFLFFTLRYYATFKVRKSESLFYKINTFLQKITTCTGPQGEQILSVNVWYAYFFNLGRIFLCYFQNLLLFVIKKFWTNFCCIVLLSLWATKMCPRFLKSYFRLKIFIFLSFVVSLLVDMFN